MSKKFYSPVYTSKSKSGYDLLLTVLRKHRRGGMQYVVCFKMFGGVIDTWIPATKGYWLLEDSFTDLNKILEKGGWTEVVDKEAAC